MILWRWCHKFCRSGDRDRPPCQAVPCGWGDALICYVVVDIDIGMEFDTMPINKISNRYYAISMFDASSWKLQKQNGDVSGRRSKHFRCDIWKVWYDIQHWYKYARRPRFDPLDWSPPFANISIIRFNPLDWPPHYTNISILRFDQYQYNKIWPPWLTATLYFQYNARPPKNVQKRPWHV